MANLPFVVQPRLKPRTERIGSENVGYIDIERRGYLSVAEKSFVQAASKGDNAQPKLFALVNRLSVKEGIPAQQVMEEISSGEIPSYAVEHVEELLELLGGMTELQEKMKVMTAAALLTSRVDSEISIYDVMSLHPELLEGLNALYNDEEAKAIERLEESLKEGEADDTEGKSPEAK